MAAPTDRPLPLPGRDTRPGAILLALFEHGQQTAPQLARRLVLRLDTVRATVEQLDAAQFVCASGAIGRWEITRHGRAYLGFILGRPLPERRRPVGPRAAGAFSHEVNRSQSL